jgi:hypothetical protein
MKRCWIGVVCLVLLLMGGLYVDRVMGRSHAPVSQDLDRAAECAMAEDWTGAEAFTDRARENWEKNWHFSAAFADHEPMENIDALFSRLTVFVAAREKEEFGALCRELSRQVKAMGDAHDLKWWNLL